MVELLAPAGDKECFKAALMAGADAIYVGGKKYGARAYAGNFEPDDLIECLHMAHLFQKKVYLTINTLMKQKELDALVSFLQPFYEEGLDGVIVQDLGALLCIGRAFPGMELHASTQMTVTGAYGAELLKQYGVSRVVPARELSLDEIVRMKKETGLEIETFVHGAMCYGYSGQCLFSSMLGERSGNRGRCAGPCRLPYRVSYEGKQLNNKNELYQLSLKDLCTLEALPKLIEAGVDSFKIEGRMKTPEYVSFVTGMYRKYIDLYIKNPKQYCVTKEDIHMLQHRFSRGSIQSGYYFQHNGRELLTLNKPGYQSFSTEEYFAEEQKITDLSHEKKELKIDLAGHFTACAEALICFTVSCKEAPEMTVTVYGPEASKAQKCAATVEDVKKQLRKTGNTSFLFTDITFDMGDDLFLPNKALNDLRREALSQMEALLLQKYQRKMPEHCEAELENRPKPISGNRQKIFVEVRTVEQLAAVTGVSGIDRVCLDVDVFTTAEWDSLMQKVEHIKETGTEIYIKLPHVCRQKTIKNIERYRAFIEKLSPDGFCVGNLESLGYVTKKYPGKNVMSDAGFYIFNAQTTVFFADHGIREHILSYEMHKKEIQQLAASDLVCEHSFILPVYGYIPVMETAGCLLKTNGACRKGEGGEQVVLTDRHNKDRMVVTHCDRCENTIYNSVPLSLHKEREQISKLPIAGIVLKFTIENISQTNQILGFWTDRRRAEATGDSLIREFTKGHFAKGVE